MKLTGLAAAAALATVLVLSACSASGGGSGSGTGGSGSGSGSSSGAASLKISGDYTGTVAANNCVVTGKMSITATIDGTKYLGTITATEASIVGPSAADYVTDAAKDPTLPTLSSDSNTFTLSSVHIYDLIGGKSMVLDGTITCP